MKLFKIIGLFFVGLFNAAKKAFNELTPEQQEALKHGSGMVAVLNNTIGQAPELVKAAIHEQFPNLDVPKLEAGLKEVADGLGLLKEEHVDYSIEGLIGIIQAKLEKLKETGEGKKWAAISHAAASILAIVFAPEGTKFSAISSLLEWVYQQFFKKSLDEETEAQKAPSAEVTE